jgi:hypothetical protein
VFEGAFDGKFRANGSWLRLIKEKLPSLRNGGHHLSEKFNMKHSRHSFIPLKRLLLADLENISSNLDLI